MLRVGDLGLKEFRGNILNVDLSRGDVLLLDGDLLALPLPLLLGVRVSGFGVRGSGFGVRGSKNLAKIF